MIENTVLVETRELTKIYGNGNEVVALDHVSMTIQRGEFVAVMGPSGSGKSTLLNMLGALDRPSSGQVIVDGQDLARVKSLDRFRGRTVGFIFQLHNLLPTLSALENVEVPMRGQAGLGAQAAPAGRAVAGARRAGRSHAPSTGPAQRRAAPAGRRGARAGQ